GVGAGKPMVGRPVTVDPDKRTTETERLQSLYRLVEAKIVRDQRASLERAVDRLLASPDLAATFVAG
ncbi:MAG: hypothetical protein ABI867_24480, partial [Kofleriaceae bacterium]